MVSRNIPDSIHPDEVIKGLYKKPNDDLLNVDFMGVQLYEKGDNVLDSKLLGVKIKYIALGGLVLWMLKKA